MGSAVAKSHRQCDAEDADSERPAKRINCAALAAMKPELWAWGARLGPAMGPGFSSPAPIEAMQGRRVRSVACGYSHVMVTTEDGELWAAGSNMFGELGIGDHGSGDRAATATAAAAIHPFTRVVALAGRKVDAVACGEFFTLALIAGTGELLAWGRNNRGQLGLGDRVDRSIPTQIPGFRNCKVAMAACGRWHAVAVLDTGDLFEWGACTADGSIELGDAIRGTPVLAGALVGRRIVAVSCGGWHTAAIDDTGDIHTWGSNYERQLGEEGRTHWYIPQVVKDLHGRRATCVACGLAHTLALLETGEVFAWGDNDVGQLGIGRSGERCISVPRQVHAVNGLQVRSVHAGSYMSAAVLATGELYTWGCNDSLVHKLGDRAVRPVPLPVDELTGKCVLMAASGDACTMVIVRSQRVSE